MQAGVKGRKLCNEKAYKLMDVLRVDSARCAKDGLCVTVCPCMIVESGPDKLPRVRPDAAARCIKCGHCVAICPHDALFHSGLPGEAGSLAAWRNRLTPGSLDIMLKSRRSHRHFESEPLDQAAIAALLNTARYAPTATNSQLVTWTVSLDPKRTRDLAQRSLECLLADPYVSRMFGGRRPTKDVILHGAPHVVVAMTPADYPWGLTDCSTALAYLDLTASAHGYGACWAGFFLMALRRDPALVKALAIPTGLTVHGAMILGRPQLGYYSIPPRGNAVTTWL